MYSGRWGTPTDVSAVMTDFWPMSSAMRSNDDIDWPGHSLCCSSMIYLRDLSLRRLPSSVPCGMMFF